MKKQNQLLAHIQVLRATSVLIVLFYHIKFDLFDKGYLGVDIFFVISGFVITNKLLDEFLEDSSISLKKFYINRFWRIFPNLIFILFVVFIFYKFFGPPDISLFNDFIFSLIGISNLFFLVKEVDYFNNIFDNPLGHTWSLGIEEQFYVIYPIFLLILLSKTKNFNSNSIFLSIISLFTFISIFVFDIDNLNVFYNPFFRFWEFLIGCSISFLRNIKINFLLRKILFSVSLLIIILILFFDLNLPYLFNNLFIIIASAFYLLLYNSKYFSINLFTNKFLVHLGNLSYSIYLWHLPIIYFSKIYFNGLTYYLIVFILTYILSLLTFNFIENFFRFYNFKKSKIKIIYISILVTFVFLVFSKPIGIVNLSKISNYFNINNYLEKNYLWIDRTTFRKMTINKYRVYDFCAEVSENFTKNKYGLKKECLKSENKDEIFYLKGNSYVAQFIPVFNNSKKINNFYYVHRSVNTDIEINELNQFAKIYKKVFFVTQINDQNNLDIILENVKKDKLSTNVAMLLIGPIPNFYVNHLNPLTCMVQRINCSVKKNFDFEQRSLQKLINNIEKISNSHTNTYFYNPYNFLCPNEECLIYDKDKDKLMLRDEKHLSFEGSISLLNNFNDFIRTILEK